MRQLLSGIVTFFFALTVGGAGLYAYKEWLERDDLDEDDANPLTRVFGPPIVAHTVVLERHGATITGGEDDSRQLVSSVVATKRTTATIPKFGGSDKEWRELVKCVQKVFAPYDLNVVEERPASGPFVLVMVGGTPSLLGYEKKIAGLAPYNTDVVDDPVVFVFAKTLGDDPTKMCETAAEEIGHTYGLDHEYNCKDPMTYLASCGTQAFQSGEYSCGEYEKRPCKNGQPKQNSHARLLAVLGPHKPAPTTPVAKPSTSTGKAGAKPEAKAAAAP